MKGKFLYSFFFFFSTCFRCVGSYGEKNPKKPIVLIGKGTDGLKGVLSLLENDIVAYALLRVVSEPSFHPSIMHLSYKSF